MRESRQKEGAGRERERAPSLTMTFCFVRCNILDVLTVIGLFTTLPRVAVMGPASGLGGCKSVWALDPCPRPDAVSSTAQTAGSVLAMPVRVIQPASLPLKQPDWAGRQENSRQTAS